LEEFQKHAWGRKLFFLFIFLFQTQPNSFLPKWLFLEKEKRHKRSILGLNNQQHKAGNMMCSSLISVASAF